MYVPLEVFFCVSVSSIARADLVSWRASTSLAVWAASWALSLQQHLGPCRLSGIWTGPARRPVSCRFDDVWSVVVWAASTVLSFQQHLEPCRLRNVWSRRLGGAWNLNAPVDWVASAEQRGLNDVWSLVCWTAARWYVYDSDQLHSSIRVLHQVILTFSSIHRWLAIFFIDGLIGCNFEVYLDYHIR